MDGVAAAHAQQEEQHRQSGGQRVGQRLTIQERHRRQAGDGGGQDSHLAAPRTASGPDPPPPTRAGARPTAAFAAPQQLLHQHQRADRRPRPSGRPSAASRPSSRCASAGKRRRRRPRRPPASPASRRAIRGASRQRQRRGRRHAGQSQRHVYRSAHRLTGSTPRRRAPSPGPDHRAPACAGSRAGCSSQRSLRASSTAAASATSSDSTGKHPQAVQRREPHQHVRRLLVRPGRPDQRRRGRRPGRPGRSTGSCVRARHATAGSISSPTGAQQRRRQQGGRLERLQRAHPAHRQRGHGPGGGVESQAIPVDLDQHRDRSRRSARHTPHSWRPAGGRAPRRSWC